MEASGSGKTASRQVADPGAPKSWLAPPAVSIVETRRSVREEGATSGRDTQKRGELIKDTKPVMRTPGGADGTLHSRPMVPQRGAFAGELCFFTKAPPPKVDDVQHNRHVSVA